MRAAAWNNGTHRKLVVIIYQKANETALSDQFEIEGQPQHVRGARRKPWTESFNHIFGSIQHAQIHKINPDSRLFRGYKPIVMRCGG